MSISFCHTHTQSIHRNGMLHWNENETTRIDIDTSNTYLPSTFRYTYILIVILIAIYLLLLFSWPSLVFSCLFLRLQLRCNRLV